jgi:hypothetical protein
MKTSKDMIRKILLPAMLAGTLYASPVQAQPRNAEGFSCVVIGKSGQTVRTSAGSTVEAPARLPNCEGADILGDGLQVCFVNERREKRCRELKKGSVVTRAALGAAETGGLADTVISMAKGDTRSLAGQTRADTRSDGLPYGQVLGAGGSISYDLSLDFRVQRAQRLRLTEDAADGATIWEETASQPVRGQMPVQGLKADTWYRWVADVSGRRVTGRFLFLGAAGDPARTELLRLASDTELTPEARLYLSAELFNEAGLGHERLIAIGALQRLIGSSKP